MFRLALELGRTVAELEQSLGSGELTEWLVFYGIEPFGAVRDNLHAAIISSTIANYSGKLRTPIKNLTEFMIETPQVKRDRETRKTIAMMDAMAKR